MSRLVKVVEKLQEEHSVDLEDFMELYKRGLSREKMSNKLGVSIFTMRQLFDRLGLSAKKSSRAESYLKFYIEYEGDKANKEEVLNAPLEENKHLTHKLKVAQRALTRSRDEANFLRNAARKEARAGALKEQVLDIVSNALPIRDKRNYEVIIPGTPTTRYKEHTSCIILSDLHVEEAVSRKDVGRLNEYDWEVMESRLEKLMREWLTTYRGESRAVVIMAGDFVSGVIHNVLENTTKPTAEAVHDLADILSGYMKTAALVFDQVDIVHVGGNHDRISENTKSSHKGFDFSYLFAQILKAKLTDTKNISLDISTTGYAATKVGKKVVGVHHGDLHRGPVYQEHRTFRVYEAFKSSLGVDVDHVVQGHTHQFGYCNTHKGVCIVNGSLIGSNAYGHANGFVGLRPSQTLVRFLPSGDVDVVRQIFLD